MAIDRPETLTLTYASAGLGIGGLVLLTITGSPAWLVVDVAIYGWLSLAIGPGEALGAWVGGWFFDAWGSYLPAFGFAVAALAAGLVAIWRVRAGHPGRAGST